MLLQKGQKVNVLTLGSRNTRWQGATCKRPNMLRLRHSRGGIVEERQPRISGLGTL